MDRSGAHDRWLAIARHQFDAQGNSSQTEFRTATHAVLAAEAIHPHGGNVLQTADGFVAIAGTLFYQGRFGHDALKALFSDFRAPFDNWDDIAGQFAALICKDGQLHVFGDYFAIFNIFASTDGRFVSTSFLSLARVLERLSVDPQSAYEFAYNSGVLGDASFFNEIRRLSPRQQLKLGTNAQTYKGGESLFSRPMPRLSLADLVEQQVSQLRGLAQIVRDAFGYKVCCPLSGGYDSRLLLALLRNTGIAPRVYVYGPADSTDVRISKEIGAGEGFAVEHFDKQSYEDKDTTFAEHVARDFNRVDGMSVDGSVFDNGGNKAARDRLQHDSTITSSGGGGEIFRNFFRLPDRSFSLRSVTQSFYRQFDPQSAVAKFDVRDYDTAIERKMSETLETSPSRVDRRSIELLYPAFRCRANYGREISIVGRHGAYFVPFLEPSTVKVALRVPLSKKNAGRYEALLIRKLDPSLARYRTVYAGQGLTPGWRVRADEAATRRRPIWLRKMSYRLRSALAPQGDGHGGLLDSEHLGKVIDLQFPAMRTYFRPEKFRDEGLLRRVALMEYLVARLGSKVVVGHP